MKLNNFNGMPAMGTIVTFSAELATDGTPCLRCPAARELPHESVTTHVFYPHEEEAPSPFLLGAEALYPVRVGDYLGRYTKTEKSIQLDSLLVTKITDTEITAKVMDTGIMLKGEKIMNNVTVAVETSATPETRANTLAPTSEPTLPVGYLSNLDKRSDPFEHVDYIIRYAKQIASGLGTKMSYASFQSFMRPLYPYHRTFGSSLEVRRLTLFKLRLQATRLVKLDKAPKLLVDLLDALIVHVKNDRAWLSMMDHLDSVACYMSANENDNESEENYYE